VIETLTNPGQMPNKRIILIAIPLRSIAAGELCRKEDIAQGPCGPTEPETVIIKEKENEA